MHYKYWFNLSSTENKILTPFFISTEKWPLPQSRKNIGPFLNKILIFLQFVLILFPATFAVHAATYPEFPIYISSSFSPPYSKLLLTLNSFVYWVLLTQSWILFNIQLQGVLTHQIFLTPIMATDLRATPKRSDLSLANLPKEYRSFEIVHWLSIDPYGNLILPLHITIYTLMMFASAILVQNSQNIGGKTVIIICHYVLGFGIFWGVLLHFGGYYFTQNLKTVRSWGKLEWSLEDKKYIKKFIKSCKPLQMGDQARFKFNKLTLLFFIRGISRGVVRILLTT